MTRNNNNNKVPSQGSDGTLCVLDEEYYAWARQGICNSPYIDADLFFTQGKRYELAAKMVCKPCSVKAQCLAFALKYGQEGIWGETDEDQRRDIARRQNISPIKLVTLNLSA